MFTGLVGGLGKVQKLQKVATSYQLTIDSQQYASILKIGDSIAVNGVCLTVVINNGHQFTVDVMPETVRNTIIGSLQSGERVNLERTLRMADGLDGHIVTGHVEGIGTISKIATEGFAHVITIQTPSALLKYIVSKGSIAIDGISLTVTQVKQDSFSVSIIPHTMQETTLGFKTVGAKVNLETDILAKYVEKMLGQNTTGGLTKASLLANGFM